MNTVGGKMATMENILITLTYDFSVSISSWMTFLSLSASVSGRANCFEGGPSFIPSILFTWASWKFEHNAEICSVLCRLEKNI